MEAKSYIVIMAAALSILVTPIGSASPTSSSEGLAEVIPCDLSSPDACIPGSCDIQLNIDRIVYVALHPEQCAP